jgi:hypothetical protein
MIFVPLKIYCRKRSGGWGNVRMDDYLSVVALMFANGFFYVSIIGTPELQERIKARTDMNKGCGNHWACTPAKSLIQRAS